MTGSRPAAANLPRIIVPIDRMLAPCLDPVADQLVAAGCQVARPATEAPLGWPELAGIDVGLWSGIFAPAGTPPSIVRKLESEFRKMMQMADVKEKFKAMATPTVGGTAADFARTIDVETKMWGEVGKVANVKLE